MIQRTQARLDTTGKQMNIRELTTPNRTCDRCKSTRDCAGVEFLMQNVSIGKRVICQRCRTLIWRHLELICSFLPQNEDRPF